MKVIHQDLVKFIYILLQGGRGYEYNNPCLETGTMQYKVGSVT